MGRIGRTQRIYLKKMNWLGFMEEMKGWNTKTNFRLLEKKETRIRDTQEVIQDIENFWNMKNIVRQRDPQGRDEEIPSSPKQCSSPRPDKPKSSPSRTLQKSLLKRGRRQGDQGRNKTSFNQRKK
ncbi:hypothetical protein O181_069236 [Austropuccinia psidii MF-1]|uniref:Uncharacterized protein n=1 Tax=Austropuccinia psidii MF-1 TaxID=1389203 RepID=A0A9Q3F347_9BASI|nr:hypothetical protein [Austropuccinia psidii MF-1]